jgi:DNA-binding XRE family transcriptional regulator
MVSRKERLVKGEYVPSLALAFRIVQVFDVAVEDVFELLE